MMTFSSSSWDPRVRVPDPIISPFRVRIRGESQRPGRSILVAVGCESKAWPDYSTNTNIAFFTGILRGDKKVSLYNIGTQTVQLLLCCRAT